jgi:hypothetical protein
VEVGGTGQQEGYWAVYTLEGEVKVRLTYGWYISRKQWMLVSKLAMSLAILASFLYITLCLCTTITTLFNYYFLTCLMAKCVSFCMMKNIFCSILLSILLYNM